MPNTSKKSVPSISTKAATPSLKKNGESKENKKPKDDEGKDKDVQGGGAEDKGSKK